LARAYAYSIWCAVILFDLYLLYRFFVIGTSAAADNPLQEDDDKAVGAEGGT
jgi:hypothetical protein